MPKVAEKYGHTFGTSSQEDTFLNPGLSAQNMIDYDFLGQNDNGLDSVLRLGIGQQSILVSSKCDDTEIRALAEKNGIRLLPKNLISLVRPVSIAGELPA